MESNWLGKPPPARHLGEVLDVISHWKAREQEYIAATNIKDTEARRYNILLSMCPPDLKNELTNKMDTLNTFDKVEAWIKEVVHYRLAMQGGQEGRGISSFEDVNAPEAEPVEVDGELFWLKRTDGKMSFTRTKTAAPPGTR